MSPSQSSALVCSACQAGAFSYEGFRQAVSKGHYNNTTGYSYSTTWSKIAQSISHEACHWCTVVRRTRDALPTEKFPRPGEDKVDVRIQIETGLGKSLAIFLNGEKAATYTIYAKQGEAAVKEIGKEVTIFKKQPYVDYGRALECVKACNDHEHCSRIEETLLPTRVIDCSDPSKPRLFETHRNIKGLYCTLSYAWGGEQHQKTTTANVDGYIHKGINVPLPQTIVDAIYVTNKLGCKYLWVDALCIIQDSTDDKLRELGDMAHIYSDSYITISVLSSFRADQGFLPDERPPDVLPYYVNGSKSPSRMLMEFNIPRQTPGFGKYETVEMYTPLDERGWCLQESTLAPRRLIFQPPNLSYKCRSFSELDIARLSPRDRSLRGDSTAYPADDYIIFSNNKGNNPKVDDDELRERWRKILWDYSERKITAATDKYVALAAVAEIFQSVSKDRYLAGLWERTFIDDLLWEIWPPMGPDDVLLPRPEVYRAPTWSWASVDAKLHLETFRPTSSDASYEAEIIGCKVTPKSNLHPLGEVAQAELTLKVKMHSLMRNGQKCAFTEIKGGRTGDQFVSTSTSWKWLPPVGNCLEPRSPRLKDNGEERLRGITFDSLEGTAPNPMDFHVVILRAGRQWRNQGDWMHGLLVVRVDGRSDQYRRVAKLDLQYNLQWPDWFDGEPIKTITLI